MLLKLSLAFNIHVLSTFTERSKLSGYPLDLIRLDFSLESVEEIESNVSEPQLSVKILLHISLQLNLKKND